MTMRVILRKIVIRGKAQCSVVDIRLVQLPLKFVFMWKFKLGLWYHQRCSIYRQEEYVKLALLNVMPAKALQLDVFPKDSLAASETGLWVV